MKDCRFSVVLVSHSASPTPRYVEAFERLTEIPFDRYLADPEVVLR